MGWIYAFMLLGRLILRPSCRKVKAGLVVRWEAFHITYSRFHLLSPATDYWVEEKPNRVFWLRIGKISILQSELLEDFCLSAQKSTVEVTSEPSIPEGTSQSSLAETLAKHCQSWVVNSSFSVVKVTINQMLTRPLTSTVSMKVPSIKHPVWFKKTLLWWVRFHPVFEKSVLFVFCAAQLTPYLMLQAWKHFPLHDLIWSNFQKSLQGKQRYLMSPACPQM